MAKLTLNTIGSRYGSIDALNNNSDLVEAAFENTLSRDGTGPNGMEADLDMNSHAIINYTTDLTNPSSLITVGALDGQYVNVTGDTMTGTLNTPRNNTDVLFIGGVQVVPETIIFAPDANSVQYDPAGTGAVETTVQSKLREFVSLKDFGAIGDGVADDTVALQAAVNYAAATSRSLYIPPGTYIISARVFQQTNGARMTIFGAGYTSSIIKAASTLTNTEMLYFGNSTGHGVYGLNLRDIGINGFAEANNVTGIVALENGLAHFENIRIENCGLGARCDGSIHMIWDGHNEIRGTCTQGISFLRIPRGTPSGPFDYTVTLGPLAMSTNLSSIQNTWFSGSSNGCIVMEGGLVSVENCVFQSPGGDATKSVVLFENANESYDYGGGPRFTNNWIEGGTYKYWVEVINTRNAVLTDNFFSGSSVNSEGGFLLRSKAENCVIERNSFRGSVTATPTEGRYRNAAVYLDVDSANVGFSFSYRDNYLTKSGSTNLQFVIANVNINGVTNWRYCIYNDMNGLSPIVYSNTGTLSSYYPDRNVHACGVITYSAGVPTITNSFNVNLIVDSGVGFLTVQYGRSKEILMQPLVATASEATGIPYMVGTMRSSLTIDRIKIYDSAAAAIDPDSISFVCLGSTL